MILSHVVIVPVRQKRKSSPNRKYCYKGGQGFEENRMYNATPFCLVQSNTEETCMSLNWNMHVPYIQYKDFFFKNKEIFAHGFQNFSVDLVTSESRGTKRNLAVSSSNSSFESLHHGDLEDIKGHEHKIRG